MQHGLPLPSQQRVHAHPTLRGQRLEAQAVQFVGDEHIALVGGQFLQRGGDRLQAQRAGIGGFGPAVRGGQRPVQPRAFVAPSALPPVGGLPIWAVMGMATSAARAVFFS